MSNWKRVEYVDELDMWKALAERVGRPVEEVRDALSGDVRLAIAERVIRETGLETKLGTDGLLYYRLSLPN